MENRFLFRAKRIDNSEWVEGFLFLVNDVSYILPHHNTGQPIHIDNLLSTSVEVSKATICQCTGLKDDEGTLIFENDVLSLKDEINECEWKAVVKFGNPNAEYTWGWQLVPLAECDANKDILMWVETGMGYMYCNIIGNRFDNTELLEV
mgnify:FL=1